ncbi:FecR family protein [Dyadobacter sp. CY326]|uniref:FecR family protein n=1 Tax=Dyadobacter sp. CY326 TaxID=2907300 RepID=UPI001F490F4B|nr:FecR family protein [Dyadobacter sp. CY326]MCE7064274.1 FecR family protein [Dyadobacter sp. CY326]
MHSNPSADLQNLLGNPQFVAWAKGGRPEDDGLWMQWAAGHQERQDTISTAKEIVNAMDFPVNQLTDEHISDRVALALRTAKRIEKEQEARPTHALGNIHFSNWNIAATAIILLGLGLALFGIYTRGYLNTRAETSFAKAASANEFAEIVNKSLAVKYVRLSDGSAIVLQKNSSVRFPKHFKKTQREVFLTGEAFFEVTKNPEQPFFVYANELIAKVHGTSFSIKAGENDSNVIVAVKTGKVSVFTKNDAKASQYQKDKNLEALLLTPNQQATFERSQLKLTRLPLRSPTLLNIPIENQAFNYIETPVRDVFEALEKAYGIRIDFNKDTMAHCSITATLGDEPLENKLKWICTILEAEYAVNEDKVTIKGNPCN